MDDSLLSDSRYSHCSCLETNRRANVALLGCRPDHLNGHTIDRDDPISVQMD